MKETGFFMPVEDIRRLAGHYMTDPDTGKLELQNLSAPNEWTKPPVFPSGAAGLLSAVDDYLAFARLLLDKGAYEGGRLLSEQSVTLMTTNHLTPDQIADGGLILVGRGWGFGMAVVTAPDDVSAVPGRCGWEGGYGTGWFNDPNRNLVAIAMTQTSDFLFNGGLAEFERHSRDMGTAARPLPSHRLSKITRQLRHLVERTSTAFTQRSPGGFQ
jgi:CubicO group peptidase (beta-lactamase class C family)